MYFNNPAGERIPVTSSASGIWGPKVMIINEMAGSGGDTPPFVDGGSMIAPRFGFIDAQGNFAVENVGVAPDIEVENYPREVIAGRDPQLERAVHEALRLVREQPPQRITREPVAPTWGRRPIP